MALDLSKLNFFNQLGARARVFVLLLGMVGMLFLVYLGTQWLSGGSRAIGPSHVASAPAGLQSIPGGQLSPEYSRAVMQANTQAAEQAKMTGGSAIPTLMNIGQSSGGNGSPCNIICSDKSVNVKDLLEDWQKQGKISPDDAAMLQQLADKNVGVDEYAAQLDQLVKQGKLTPEQARELLEQYKKQHANANLQESADVMDKLIKSGQVPLDVANDLLNAQKSGISPSNYAAKLQEMVAQGKISPEVAQQLLAQYSQQYAKEVTMRSIATLQKMAQQGEITSDVLKDLIDLENKMVPTDLVASTLQKYVTAGKLTPGVSDKILNEYKDQKAQIGPTQEVNQIVQRAEAERANHLAALVKEGKVSADAAARLDELSRKDVSPAEYEAAVNALVAQGKISPEVAQKLINDYKKVKEARAMAQSLAKLQANNASGGEYANELKRAVQAGLLSPEEAARLMQNYQAMTSRAAIGSAVAAGTSQYAALQQQVQQANVGQPLASAQQFTPSAETSAAEEQARRDRQARMESMLTAMSGQAQQLLTAWQAPVMVHREGAPAVVPAGATITNASGMGNTAASGTGTSTTPATPALIKAGTILFATLDTAVNSDYPDSPIMATIVDGPYKGSKVLGKLVTTKGVSGQMDRVSLNFTIMNYDVWPASKTVTAYAIDPDTARTALASQVNYHYLQKFGAIMATSFIQGYANAINSSASTTTTGIFGTSTTHPELSPGQKLASALGQVGTALSAVTQNYTNIPPTVRVDSGASLGILFMTDVT